MRLRNVWVGALAVALAASVAACGGKQETSSTSAEPPPGATKVDAATAAEVSGTVALDGAAPMNEPIKMNADPRCVTKNTTPQFQETYQVTNGKPIQGMKMTHNWETKEVMVPFKCDVHGWMNAYVGVLDHPYFMVTVMDGKFNLKTVPPGTYTIEAWHEKLGAMTQSVTLGPKETKEITFTFKASGPAATD